MLYFKQGKNATERQTKKISAIYGESAVTDKMCQKWFAMFCAGDFLLDDAPWSGSPDEIDNDQIKTLI